MTAVARRIAQAALGLATGLSLAEGAFWLRDRGGFPHLNVYEPDAELGVRLRPGASQRVSLGNNPVTRVHIGPLGLRGEGPARPGGVLVLGDSQVFGLGVEEQETFSARLEERLALPVRNAGVPTYGPHEYQALLDRLLPLERPAAVVLTVNMANDLFEATRPNTERHAVWDGWAVRKEHAPSSAPLDFPGRSLVFRDSHLAYAARGLLSRRVEGADEGVASEGGFDDLLALPTPPPVAPSAQRAQKGAEREAAEQRAREAQLRLEQLAEKAWPSMWKSKKARAYRERHGDPRDIVETRNLYSESSRSPVRTVRELQKGAEIRREIEAEIRRRAKKDRTERGEAVLEALRERDRAAKLLADAGGSADRDEPLEVPSPLAPFLKSAQASCQRAGARLVVLVLPVDGQVSPEEMKKYGEEPFDAGASLQLNRDVASAAERAGALAVDPLEALRQAEPGAFLQGDLHMTPKGHRAVADALARALGAIVGKVVPSP